MDEPSQPPGAPAAPGTPAAQPGAAPPPRKRRGCLTCCLAAVGAPLVGLLAVLVWLSLGPAPAPFVCLPPEAPLRVAARDPAELLEELRGSERWSELRGRLSPGSGGEPARAGGPSPWLLGQLLGGEAAVALGDDGQPHLIACRPGMLLRGGERLSRLLTSAGADGVRAGPGGKFFYGFIGKTALASPDRSAVAAALQRRDEILGAKGAGGPPADARVELAFIAQLFEGGRKGEALALLLDLPRPAAVHGWLRADREIVRVTGSAEVVPGKSEALPPPLPEAGPASARLAPPDALAVWVWPATAGAGRFSAAGRLEQLGRALGPDARELRDLLNQFRSAGVDAEKLVAQEAVGERALIVAGQPGSGGKRPVAAASLLIECRDPAAAWPAARKMLEAAWGPASADGKPPLVVGQPVYPHLLRRAHGGADYLELVPYPHEAVAGFRPAFGVAGKFVVLSTSRAELERILDRAAGRLPGFAWPRPAGSRPLATLLLSPQRRGQEIADLFLALGHATSDPGREPNRSDEEGAGRLGAILSEIRTLRLDWSAAEGAGGKLRLELSAELVGAGAGATAGATGAAPAKP